MERVSARDFLANALNYLEQVSQGDSVVITAAGMDIAVIAPPEYPSTIGERQLRLLPPARAV
ncbi:hypothetical protein D5S17_00915 [Pseudonocardiaceae bacterium YIM PH 21723]|nr:hypothetical protein D5S17_00915 [Pseudonocardiaceae bacterium YIM PH 21723]